MAVFNQKFTKNTFYEVQFFPKIHYELAGQHLLSHFIFTLNPASSVNLT